MNRSKKPAEPAEPDGRASSRLGLAASALMTLLLLPGLPADADDLPHAALPLEQVLAASGPSPLRFTLADGQTVVGRVVKIDTETITLRKPTGGIRALAIADLRSIDIKRADGALERGQIALLADGRYGWNGTAPAAGDERSLAVATDSSPAEGPEAGGPLIKLTAERRKGDKEDGAMAAAPAVQPEDVALVQPPATDALPAPVRLQVTAGEVSETEKFMYFRLRLSEPARQPLAIIYTMINGTATAAQDFTHRQGVVVFDPGETAVTLAAPIINDDVKEGNETFHLFITADPASVTISKRNVLATILDDDS